MITEKNIFEFKRYKDFMQAMAGPRNTRQGIRGAMAKAMRCQSTYVSQVLYGKAHFSLEQGELLGEFFGLPPEEKHFFLLLIQKDRAGTPRLQKYFQDQIDQILARRLVLTERLGQKNRLTPEDQSIYYSSWHYSAIHVALTITDLQTPKTVAEFFHLPLKRVSEILAFFESSGLAFRKGDRYEVGDVQIRLGNSSHNIIKHHTNWRNQAIESLDRETLRDLHYSATVSLSAEDVVRLKDRILEFIQDCLKTIRASKEEELYGYTIDFFNLKKSQ